VAVPSLSSRTDESERSHILTGLDLRELVSLALISEEQAGRDIRGAVTTKVLLGLVDDGRRQPRGGT